MTKTDVSADVIRDLFEGSSFGIAVYSADGSCVFANESWRESTANSEGALVKIREKFLSGAKETIRSEIVSRDSKRRLVIEVKKGPNDSTIMIASPSVDEKALEHQLNLAKGRIEALRRTDLLAITYFDVDGKIYEPNQKFLEMFGVTPDSVSSFDWKETEVDEWREQSRLARFSAMEKDKMTSFIMESRTKSGKIIPISVSIANLGSDDEYDGVALTYDLTELVEAREDAEANRHKADLALEAAKIGIWEFDMKTGICQWDERCCQMLGVKVSEIRDLSVFDGRISEADKERIRDTMLVALDGEFGQSQTVEFKVNVRGREKVLCATGRGFKLARESSPRLTGTLTDVTATRQYEQRLFESEDRFRTMAEVIPQIVFEADDDGEVLWVNRKFYEYSGIQESSNPTQERINEAIHPEDVESMRECWRHATRDGQPLELLYRLRHVSREYKWFIMRALPVLDNQGRVQRWIGSCTDVDDQKRTADQLKGAKEVAERANRMKSSFLANMSHEIRTPLGAILGFTELLGDSDLKDGEREEFLRIVSRNGQTLSRIVDDILDLSKVEAGMLPLEKNQLCPVPLIKDVVALFGERAKDKGLDLKFTSSPEVPEYLVSDGTRIRQIVSNLISNAIKFTDQGYVEVAVTADSKNWCVRVCDTGIGINKDQILCLFQPFVQGDESMNRRFGGTGLGLHLSRRLAEALGGTLVIETSKEGAGSCFTLHLPVENASSLQLPGNRQPLVVSAIRDDILKGQKILVVDDSLDNQLLIERMLTRRGARVKFASDGKAGIDLATRENFDLILMDLQMPGIDGFEATKRLRRSGSHIPIVALTAHVIEEVRNQCVEAGCDGFLTKPVKAADLVNAVQTLSMQHLLKVT